MPNEQQPLHNFEEALKALTAPHTVSKLGGETPIGGKQINEKRYTPTFTSFSSQNEKVSVEKGSPLDNLMGRVKVSNQAQQIGQRVAEFALEDKETGKLITARGERDIKTSMYGGGEGDGGAARGDGGAARGDGGAARSSGPGADSEGDIVTKDSNVGDGTTQANKLLRGIITAEVENMKTHVGVAHGALNFVVHTAAGIGNAIRIAGAAQFQATPLGMLCPELYPDKEAQSMLQKTLEASSAGARVLTQLNTTFNPASPLFRIEFDAQGAEMTRAVAKALPGHISDQLNRFAQADTEERAAVATEVFLNIITVVEGGVGLSGKVNGARSLAELASVSEGGTTSAELANIARFADSAQASDAQTLLAKAVASNLHQQANAISALARDKSSLKPLADKFREVLANLNESTQAEYAIAGGGKIRAGDGLLDHVEDYVNRMVGQPRPGGFAEKVYAGGGNVRLRRTDLGPPRSPYSWEAIGETFSPDVIRQKHPDSCVAAVGEVLSEGRLSETFLRNRIGTPGSLRQLGKELGPEWKVDICMPGEELGEIRRLCKDGPWVAKLFDNAYRGSHHVLIVDGINPSSGRILIRDTYEGTKYEMTIEKFKAKWNGVYLCKPKL